MTPQVDRNGRQDYRDIRLSSQEVQRCIDWTRAKQEFKQQRSVVDQWYDQNSSSPAVDLMGRLGEIAVCKAMDLDWSAVLDWEIRAAGDTGVDLLAYGYKVDVKTSTLKDLIFNSRNHFKADIAILVQLLGDRVKPEDEKSVWRVWGVCSKEKFLKHCEDHEYGEGEHRRRRVKVGNDKITSLEEFENYLKRKIWD